MTISTFHSEVPRTSSDLAAKPWESQSDPKDYTFWFVGLVGQEPRDRKFWEAGAKIKWNRARPGRKSQELETDGKKYKVLRMSKRETPGRRSRSFFIFYFYSCFQNDRPVFGKIQLVFFFLHFDRWWRINKDVWVTMTAGQGKMSHVSGRLSKTLRSSTQKSLFIRHHRSKCK